MRGALRIITAGVGAWAMAAGLAAARPASPPAADFTGVWTLASLTEMERPKDFKALVANDAEAAAFEKAHRGKPPEAEPDDTVGAAQSEWWERDVGLARIRGQARTSWIVAPADGQEPVAAAAKAFRKARSEKRKTDFDGPESRARSERCLDTGTTPPLQNGGYADLYRFVITPDHLAIHSEWMSDLRVVRLGGGAAHLPAQLRQAGGDSVGHWEGRTLVVETTNFSAADIGAPAPGPADDMRVVERFTRTAPDELLYEVAVTNPAVDVMTWRAEMMFRPTAKPMFEFACHEGNYALAGMLAGARRLEGKAIDGIAAGARAAAPAP